MPRAAVGKYDAIIPGLPKLPPSDASYQARVEREKEKITNREATALAQKYAELRAEKTNIERVLADINLDIAAHEQLLIESQDQQAEGWGAYGVKDNALRLPTGETVRVQMEPYGKVIDKEAFRLWCVAPADVCMTCGEREAASWHSEDVGNDPSVHVFKPGGGMERQLQLWPSTMNAMVKERLVAGEAAPDGCEAFSYAKVVFVGAKDQEAE